MNRRHPLLIAAFVLALAATVFFAVQSFRHAGGLGAPAAADEPIEGWMTPRYVALSWDVPREVVADALGLDLGRGTGPQSLEALAAARGLPVETVVATLEAAIEAHRAEAQ